MKRLLVAIAFVAVLSGSAHAEGAVALSWDSCTGPISRNVVPNAAVSLYVSVQGHTTPHKAYQVSLHLQPALGFGAMRDAWRFDAAGCQGPSFIRIDHVAPAAVAKTCPSFQGSVQSSMRIADYTYDATTGGCEAVLVNSYPPGNATEVNPAQRYFLARFQFDMSFATNGPTDPGATCGGLGVPVCILLTKFSYIVWADVSSAEERQWLVQQQFATANDPSPGGCFTDPAKPETWGAIKSQYRM